MKNLETNLSRISKSIEKSCKKSQREPRKLTLICVSKSVDIDTTEKVVQLGLKHFAENRVEQFLEKKAYFYSNDELVWHFIGNLQRRKVKHVINELDYFHALDSLKLAEEIQKRAKHKIKCFIQVNVSGETSKQGIKPTEVISFIRDLSAFDSIEVVGLMTMAPYQATELQLHHYFSELRFLQASVRQLSLTYAPCTELSMGMTNDFPIAIEEGSTFIRIGTAFFS